MKNPKIHIYFVPGLAASPKIFDFLQLPETKFELHFLEWILPLSDDEPIKYYAKRMAQLVTEKNPVLIGVSFGGIMVQEMSNFLNVKKMIIISSVKSSEEMPNRLKIIQKSKAYKLFPTKIITNIEKYSAFAFGNILKKRVKLYEEYLSVRDEKYLNWALHTVLNWQQPKPLKNIVHIQGTDDPIFPIKYIKECIPIEKGTHIMIITKAKTISELICDSL